MVRFSSSRPPKKARLGRLRTQISVFDYEPTFLLLQEGVLASLFAPQAS